MKPDVIQVNDLEKLSSKLAAKVYTVTVQLRTGEEIVRKWTSAEDATDAVFLTLTSITDEQKERVAKVDVKESK